jgi:hypothetical protein
MRSKVSIASFFSIGPYVTLTCYIYCVRFRSTQGRSPLQYLLPTLRMSRLGCLETECLYSRDATGCIRLACEAVIV